MSTGLSFLFRCHQGFTSLIVPHFKSTTSETALFHTGRSLSIWIIMRLAWVFLAPAIVPVLFWKSYCAAQSSPPGLDLGRLRSGQSSDPAPIPLRVPCCSVAVSHCSYLFS